MYLFLFYFEQYKVFITVIFVILVNFYFGGVVGYCMPPEGFYELDSNNLHELETPYNRHELETQPSRRGVYELDGSSRRYELDGSSRRYELDGSSRRCELDGSSRRYELDGSSRRYELDNNDLEGDNMSSLNNSARIRYQQQLWSEVRKGQKEMERVVTQKSCFSKIKSYFKNEMDSSKDRQHNIDIINRTIHNRNVRDRVDYGRMRRMQGVKPRR